MKEALKIEIQTITMAHILASGISLALLVVIIMKANKTDSLKAFIRVQACMLVWMIFKIFKTVAPTVEIRWLCIVGYYIAICLLEPTFLCFSYVYYSGKTMPRKWLIGIYVIPVIQMIVIATNPFHHLFYSYYDFYRDSFGWYFYIHMFIEYSYIIVGYYLCSKKFKKQLSDTTRIYRVIVTLAILTPVVFNLFYITGLLKRFVYWLDLIVIFDITPMAFTLSTTLFAYVIFQYEFFNLSPIMKNEIIYKLNTPICIKDKNNHMVYANEAFNSALDGSGRYILAETDKQIKEIKVKDKWLWVTKYSRKEMQTTQQIVTLQDITRLKEAEQNIEQQKKAIDEENIALQTMIEQLKRASKIGARNYVARELHDVLGHSLVVTIKLLEVAHLYFEQDKEKTIIALNEAMKTIRMGQDGIENINYSKKERDQRCSGTMLKQELARMIRYIKATDTDIRLTVKGLRHTMSDLVYDTIKKTCTELLTNALKHAKASMILVSLNISEQAITLLVIDNGMGCSNIQAGNGLYGIKERIALANGDVEFNSSENEGFVAHIIVPREN